MAGKEPGSFVFGLSGCHVALGAKAMVCDLSHLADLPTISTFPSSGEFDEE